MKEMILLLVGAALVNNVVLSQFLGLCPFLGVSKRTETAAGMGGAVIFVITIASGITAEQQPYHPYLYADDCVYCGDCRTCAVY